MAHIQSTLLDNHHISTKELEKNAELITSLEHGHFDPTDLFAASLANCFLTIISLMAEKNGDNLKGTTVDIKKELDDNPRRVSKLHITIKFKEGLDEKKKTKYLKSLTACPVHHSLHPDLQVIIN